MAYSLTTHYTYYINKLYKIKVLCAHRYDGHMLSPGAHSPLFC